MGKQIPIWIDYQHIFTPVILIDCETGEIIPGGLHHDWLHRLEKSDIIDFENIEKGIAETYKAKWAYGNSPTKTSTFFPAEWSKSKVIEKIFDALKNQSEQTIFDRGRWIFRGKTSDGIEIEIIFEGKKINGNWQPTGKIITAYPTLNNFGQ